MRCSFELFILSAQFQFQFRFRVISIVRAVLRARWLFSRTLQAVAASTLPSTSLHRATPCAFVAARPWTTLPPSFSDLQRRPPTPPSRSRRPRRRPLRHLEESSVWRCRSLCATGSPQCRRLRCATSPPTPPGSGRRSSYIRAPCHLAVGRALEAAAGRSLSRRREASCPSTSRRSSSAKAQWASSTTRTEQVRRVSACRRKKSIIFSALCFHYTGWPKK